MTTLNINPLIFNNNKNEVSLSNKTIEWKKQIATLSKKKDLSAIEYLNTKYGSKIKEFHSSFLEKQDSSFLEKQDLENPARKISRAKNNDENPARKISCAKNNDENSERKISHVQNKSALIRMYKLENKKGEFNYNILNEEEIIIILWNLDFANFQIIINKKQPNKCQLQINIYITEDNTIIVSKLEQINNLVNKINKINII